jgi:hypothetical protein
MSSALYCSFQRITPRQPVDLAFLSTLSDQRFCIAEIIRRRGFFGYKKC